MLIFLCAILNSYDNTHDDNNNRLFCMFMCVMSPVPVAARSKALVCGRSPAEIVGSNPTEGMDVCLL